MLLVVTTFAYSAYSNVRQTSYSEVPALQTAAYKPSVIFMWDCFT